MASLDRIRTDGFRDWYQRQLIECHAWLVSGFLGVIVFVSGIEVGADAASRFAGALLMLGGMAIAAYSWNRYRLLFATAERLGAQAVCPGCKAYARFRVLLSSPGPLPERGDAAPENPGGGSWLRVRCRKCAEEWTLK